MKYINLHTHSEYTKSSTANIKALVARAKTLDISFALTDHCTIAGVPEYIQEMTSHGLKPVIGAELTVCSQDQEPYEIVAICKDARAFKAITGIVSYANTVGLRNGEPSVPESLLFSHKDDDLIIISGAKSSLAKSILKGDYGAAAEEARKFRRAFADDFYIEIAVQVEGYSSEISSLNDKLVKLGDEQSIPVICSNSVYFVERAGHHAQKVYECITKGERLNGFHSEVSSGGYLVSIEQMLDGCGGHKEMVSRTIEIFNKISEIEFPLHSAPEYPVPQGFTPVSYLRATTESGLARRLGGPIPAEYRNRLNHEMAAIEKEVNALLIIFGLCEEFRRRGASIRISGDATTSLLAYSVGATDVDPVLWGIRFSFLSRRRYSAIPVTVPIQQIDAVCEYLLKHYKGSVVRACHYYSIGEFGALNSVLEAYGEEYFEDKEYEPEIQIAADEIKDIKTGAIAYNQGILLEDGAIKDILPVTQAGIDAMDKCQYTLFDAVQMGATAILLIAGDDGIYKYCEALDNDLDLPDGTVSTFSIEDKAALIGLQRMGLNRATEFLARRDGAFKPYEGRLGKALEATYGQLVFDQGILDLCLNEAGMNETDAMVFLDAALKGKIQKLKNMEAIFMSGCTANGLSKTEASSMFNLIIAEGPYCCSKGEALETALRMRSKNNVYL